MPDLTAKQEAALEYLAELDPSIKVIGWDTACDGPLIEGNKHPVPAAITPRGQLVNRQKEKV